MPLTVHVNFQRWIRVKLTILLALCVSGDIIHRVKGTWIIVTFTAIFVVATVKAKMIAFSHHLMFANRCTCIESGEQLNGPVLLFQCRH